MNTVHLKGIMGFPYYRGAKECSFTLKCPDNTNHLIIAKGIMRLKVYAYIWKSNFPQYDHVYIKGSLQYDSKNSVYILLSKILHDTK